MVLNYLVEGREDDVEEKGDDVEGVENENHC